MSVVFSGTSHPKLASALAKELAVPLGKVVISDFPDGETAVALQESVRGRSVFVLQTIARNPNRYLMELLILVDALKRASAKEIIAVVPYLGYARQDCCDRPGVPITARLVANLLETAGVNKLLTVDLHADQGQGFFNIPVDHISAVSVLTEQLKEIVGKDLVVAAPDLGGVKRARRFAKALNTELVIIDKERHTPSSVSVTQVIGPVAGKNVLLADDTCSTGHTIASAANACREKGAKTVIAAVTHGVFSQEALELIVASPLEYLLVSDTVDQQLSHSKLRVVSTASLLANAMKCIAK